MKSVALDKDAFARDVRVLGLLPTSIGECNIELIAIMAIMNGAVIIRHAFLRHREQQATGWKQWQLDNSGRNREIGDVADADADAADDDDVAYAAAADDDDDDDGCC